MNSPYRDRTPEENRALLEQMRKGELDEGAAVLRAKIDMAHEDVKLRDPLMYRVRKTAHHRTGTDWSIYPLYDWAHGQSDAIEGVTTMRTAEGQTPWLEAVQAMEVAGELTTRLHNLYWEKRWNGWLGTPVDYS